MIPPPFKQLGRLTDRMDERSLSYYRRRLETEVPNWHHGHWEAKVEIARQVLEVQKLEHEHDDGPVFGAL